MMARRVMAGRGGFSPKALFAAGEQGVWYDPSDFSTLFQDAAGSTPVTAVEQPVGLMLDKSKGLVLGAELVANGGFDTDTGWTKSTATISGGVATLGPNAVESAILQNGVVSGTESKWYRISWTQTFVSGGTSLTVFCGTTSSSDARYATSVSGDGTKTVYLQSLGSGISYIRFRVGANVMAIIDNISVRELPGNHAYQSVSSASRPVLSARVNLLTKTEQFDDAAWLKSNASVTQNSATAPDGTLTSDELIENTANYTHYLRANSGSAISITNGATYVFSCYAKQASGTRFFGFLTNAIVVGTGAWAVFDLINGVVRSTTNCTSSISAVGNGWYRCSMTIVANQTSGIFDIRLNSTSTNGDLSYTGNGTSGIYIWGADLRVANTGAGLPAYQRVNTSTDYDTMGFPHYLRFDGSDDWLVTNTITPGIDKAQVFAGVMKLSDATNARVIAELSDTTASNNGAFALQGPDAAGAATYLWQSKGTTLTDAQATSRVAPITNILTGIGDIAGDSAILRINGVQVDSDTGDQGTGNYGNYPLYIGARAGSFLYFNGHLYSLIVRGAQSSANLITAAERYVARKTGVTL